MSWDQRQSHLEPAHLPFPCHAQPIEARRPIPRAKVDTPVAKSNDAQTQHCVRFGSRRVFRNRKIEIVVALAGATGISAFFGLNPCCRGRASRWMGGSDVELEFGATVASHSRVGCTFEKRRFSVSATVPTEVGVNIGTSSSIRAGSPAHSPSSLSPSVCLA